MTSLTAGSSVPTFLNDVAKSRLFWPLVLLVLAVSVRMSPLWQVARFDELYHVLAAEGWLAEGRPAIGTGEYWRAYLFTVLIAYFFDLFGTTIEVARLPSIIAGSLLVASVFVWTRARAGVLAAWIAALLLCFSPLEIAYSHFTRFYVLQALLFWLGSTALFKLVTAPGTDARESENRVDGSARRSAPILITAALLCFGVALHLQITTLIGLMGLAAWLAFGVLLPRLSRQPISARLPWIAASAALAVVVAIVALTTGFAADLLARYRVAETWAQAEADNVWYYVLLLLRHHPILWMFTPAALVVSFLANRKTTWLCASVFVIGFVLFSFGGMKGYRFIYFIMPFLFVIWGIALQAVAGSIKRHCLKAGETATAPLLARLRMPASCCGLFAVALVAAAAIGPPLARSAAILAGLTDTPLKLDDRWPEVSEAVKPWLTADRVVVSDSELHGLYYLGRLDFAVSRTALAGTSGNGPFSYDHRTGVSFANNAESMALIMDCFPRGLIVLTEDYWTREYSENSALAGFVAQRTTPVALPERFAMRALIWDGLPPERASACQPVYDARMPVTYARGSR
ncbi:MAG: hypothetical protein IPM60_07545 [Rhodospirillales bacterium]|nr:hypothetical protein [Rhodospirillales bacterium]